LYLLLPIIALWTRKRGREGERGGGGREGGRGMGGGRKEEKYRERARDIGRE